VNTCVGGTRLFGDLNDPNSRVSKLKNAVLEGKIKGVTHYGEKPLGGTQVFYIFPEEADRYHVPDLKWPKNERVWKNSAKPAGTIAAGVAAGLIAASAVAGAFDKDPVKSKRKE
jgi:hypothetical protein